MGAPETLTAFLKFAWEHYPAEHVSLIFWDHGGGPLLGYGCDELFSNDSLDLAELYWALEKSPFGRDQKLDLIGFDACLMANLECMRLMGRYADYFVGSQELEPGPGWNYGFLSAFNDTRDPRDLAKAIIKAYGDFYEREKSPVSDPPVTLSCVSLGEISRVASALNTFSAGLSGELTQGHYNQLQKSRSQVQAFGLPESGREAGFQYDLIDLMDMAEKLQPGEKSRALIAAIEKAVVYNYSNGPLTCGISIYYPFSNKSQFTRRLDDYRQISPAVNYTRFLSSAAQRWDSGQVKAWNLGELSLKDREFTYQMTREQQENTVAAYYTVFQEVGGYSFFPLLSRVRVYPDSRGTLHIPADPRILALDTEGLNVWPARQLSQDRRGAVYALNHTRVFTESFAQHRMLGKYDLDRLPISLVLRENRGSPQLQVLSISAESPEITLSGKHSLDISCYDGLTCTFACPPPRRDRAGAMLPSSEWDQDSQSLYLKSVPISRQVRFSMVPCSRFSGEFRIQLELEDVNGHCYGSELTPVPMDPGIKSIATSCGSLTYRLQSGFAEIIGYEGTDETLKIPESLEGLPVTTVAGSAFSRTALKSVELPEGLLVLEEGAFSYCYDLQTVILPEGLKKIGNLAFFSCSALKTLEIPEGVTRIGQEAFELCTALEKIRLPSTLKQLGDALFRDCESLKTIQVSGNPQACRLEDGVLYSEDFQTLLAFPAAREGSFTLPEGIRRIAPGAFSRCRLREVVFPDSLEEIGNFSFVGSENLAPPRLPENLRSIGFHAFGIHDWQSVFKGQADVIPEIEIGPNLRFLGDGAFDGFGARRFTVSPQNPVFSSREGNLCNGAGDSLIAFSMDGTPTVKLPEGIREFSWDRLSFLQNLYLPGDGFSYFELYLPRSLSSITGDVEPLYSLLLYAPEDSFAASCLKEHRVPYLQGSFQPFRSIDVPTESGTLGYRLYDSYAMLESYQGFDKKLTLPREVEGLPVKIIGNGINPIVSDTLQELTIGEGTEILNRNCLSFRALQTLNLPDSIQRIEAGALRDIPLITLQDLPENLTYLGDDSLGSTQLARCHIPKSLTEISEGAFTYLYTDKLSVDPQNPVYGLHQGLLCSKDGTTVFWAPKNLKTLNLPEGTEKIGSYAFSGTLLKTADLPDSVRSIGPNAFSFCESLSQLTLPQGLIELGDHAFSHCTELESLHIPGSLSRVSAYAFSRCRNLKEITLDPGVTLLETGCFAYDGSLTALSFPESLTTIDYSTFQGFATPPIEGPLHLGGNLQEIGGNPFGPLNLKAFSVSSENDRFSVSQGMLLSRDGLLLLACPAGKTGSVNIPQSVKLITRDAFSGCRDIKDLWIPDSVEEIQGVLPEGVTIHCSLESAAHRYARENGYSWKAD